MTARLSDLNFGRFLNIECGEQDGAQQPACAECRWQMAGSLWQSRAPREPDSSWRPREPVHGMLPHSHVCLTYPLSSTYIQLIWRRSLDDETTETSDIPHRVPQQNPQRFFVKITVCLFFSFGVWIYISKPLCSLMVLRRSLGVAVPRKVEESIIFFFVFRY